MTLPRKQNDSIEYKLSRLSRSLLQDAGCGLAVLIEADMEVTTIGNTMKKNKEKVNNRSMARQRIIRELRKTI